MDIREVDNRYPEFARPYEPVKGRKRYGRLKMPKAMMLAMAGLATVFLAAILPPAGRLPDLPVAAVVETLPPTTATTPPPTTPPPTTPPPTPVVIRPIVPVYVPPTDPPVTDPPPTTPPPSAPPITPPPSTPPSPVPKDTEPEVSMDHVYYWDQINHAEVSYLVTANDATDIVSWARVDSAAEPGMGFYTVSEEGDGVIAGNVDVTELMEPHSADAWNITITLEYKLNGENKTKTFTFTEEPKWMGLLRLYSIGTTALGGDRLKTVTCKLGFYYPKDYRHSFTPEFYGIKVGWMDSSYNKVAEGDMRTVWDGSGDCPIQGPVGPTADGDDMLLTYTYTGAVNVSPSAAAADAGAKYYYLEFYMDGEAKDTEEPGTYEIYDPYSVYCTPQPLYAPTLTFSHLWYWGEFNAEFTGEYGLCHLEAGYSIIPNGADEGSIRSSVRVISNYDSSKVVEKNGIEGDGDITANWNSYGILHRNSSERWITEIRLSCTIGGTPYSETLTVPAQEPNKAWRLEVRDKVDEDLMSYIEFFTKSDDRHIYTVAIDSIEVVWMKEEDGYYSQVGEPTVVWTPDVAEVLEGPFGPTVYGDESIIDFTYNFYYIEFESIKPEGATHFHFRYNTTVTGADTDGTVYPHVGNVPNYSFGEYLIPTD